MNGSNPYASPETPVQLPSRIPLRDRQILRQVLFYSLFYFVGLASLLGVVAGFSAVPRYLSDVMEEFTSLWLPELLFVLVPYVVLRGIIIGRFVRSAWWSFCIAGLVTYPFLTLYMNLLIRDWDTPSYYHIGAHLLCVVSAIMVELCSLALFSRLLRKGPIAEHNGESVLPMTGE
jgi:hypothetical protein